MLSPSTVLPGSVFARAGVVPGDRLVSINGNEIRDVIDYQFFAADERLKVVVEDAQGHRRSIRLTRHPDDMLGLEFTPFPVRRCRNNCIFCFVDQMPAGCRKSLYVKDDDYRASFLFGNYITLSNLNEADWERIVDQRLSPLYLSVHATEPELRKFMIRNPKAPDILSLLRRLADNNIRMHTQIVLCPGINDGTHLLRTIEDLASLFPLVQSIAAVPVGLTAHREGRYPLRTYRRSEAGRVIDALERYGAGHKRRNGTRLVYPSDEFYLQAGRGIPSPSFYEDYPQIENGVGMVSSFLVEAAAARLPKKLPKSAITAVTGVSFSSVLKESLGKLTGRSQLSVRLVTAKNHFFGPSVTVAGLLTGGDILRAIKGKRLGSALLIPAACIKDDRAVFLDDMGIDELEHAAGVPVRPVDGLTDIVRVVNELFPPESQKETA
ncbi:MAG: DUF512 domain-containing protein [Nitrospirota bacterium]|nr:DUF512 domain-containing protein [Nitrospirota bacterium]